MAETVLVVDDEEWDLIPAPVKVSAPRAWLPGSNTCDGLRRLLRRCDLFCADGDATGDTEFSSRLNTYDLAF